MLQYFCYHNSDVIMGAMASQITSLTIVYSTVYSDTDQRKHQSSASLAFVQGIHRWPVNSPHKWPVTRKMFPFDDVIMIISHKDITYTHYQHIIIWNPIIVFKWNLSKTKHNNYLMKIHLKVSPGGDFKNMYELLHLIALRKFQHCIKTNVWVRYFVWNFKGTLWNST